MSVGNDEREEGKDGARHYSVREGEASSSVQFMLAKKRERQAVRGVAGRGPGHRLVGWLTLCVRSSLVVVRNEAAAAARKQSHSVLQHFNLQHHSCREFMVLFLGAIRDHIADDMLC